MKATLLTLLHISDLHIGLLDPGRNSNSVDAEVRDWCLKYPLFDGYLGHSGQALHQLAQLYYDLEDYEGDVRLVLTGDVTTCGHPQEFANAEAFLAGRLAEPRRRSLVGLEVEWDDVIAISGNHDNWSGVSVQRRTDLPMLGGPVPALRSYFGQFPRILPSIKMGGARAELVFCAIDSDAEVPATSTFKRLMARGSCEQQCRDLERAFGQRPTANEIRVLLVHHSYAVGGGAGQLKLDSRSRLAIESLMRNCNIKLMLSGHAHSSHIETQWPPEARCGSSTQLDDYPSWWPHKARRRKVFEMNAVLVHRVVEDAGKLWWETERYIRPRATRLRAFEPDTRSNVQNPVRVVQLL